VRILYLCADFGIPVLGRKGAAIHVRELVAALIRADHSVVVVAPVETKSQSDTPATLPAPLLRVEPEPRTDSVVAELAAVTRLLGASEALPGELRRVLYDRQLAAHLWDRFRARPPDLIYERASLHSTAGAELADALGVPLLVEVNAPLALEQRAYRGSELASLAVAAERRTLCRADAVLTVSTQLRDHVISVGVDERRVHVVPNGVDAQLFRPGYRDPKLGSRFGLNGGPVVGFVGGLRPWHGLEFLPPLLERLAARRPDVCLLIVGDGPLRSQLEGELRARKVLQNAIFTGSVPHEEVAALIRHFDAALAPYGEPSGHSFYFSPLKLFEYMACAVPVVGASIGQVAEVISDGETGLLYAPGELDAFDAACERLLADPPLRRRLGRAAAVHVRTRYTWDGNAARIAALAGTLLASRRKAG